MELRGRCKLKVSGKAAATLLNIANGGGYDEDLIDSKVLESMYEKEEEDFYKVSRHLNHLPTETKKALIGESVKEMALENLRSITEEILKFFSGIDNNIPSSIKEITRDSLQNFRMSTPVMGDKIHKFMDLGLTEFVTGRFLRNNCQGMILEAVRMWFELFLDKWFYSVIYHAIKI